MCHQVLSIVWYNRIVIIQSFRLLFFLFLLRKVIQCHANLQHPATEVCFVWPRWFWHAQRNNKPASWYIIEIMTAQSACLCVRSNKSAQNGTAYGNARCSLYTEHLQKKRSKVAWATWFRLQCMVIKNAKKTTQFTPAC